MKKPIRAALALLMAAAFWIQFSCQPVSAAPQTSIVAVVLLGSLEFQYPDYYEIAEESLQKKFPSDQYKLVIGDHPQQMFNRYSDKQGLLPGGVPEEKTLAAFARAHSFTEVIFITFTAPSIRSEEITVQWENAAVKVTAQAKSFDARTGNKLADVSTTQTVKTFGREAAKRSAFRKCLDFLREKL